MIISKGKPGKYEIVARFDGRFARVPLVSKGCKFDSAVDKPVICDCVKVLFESAVLFTLPRPTIAAVIPETVPVNDGDANGAFDAKSDTKLVTCDSEKTLAESAVLFTLPRPTIAAVIPLTVPVNVGDANGAFDAKSDTKLVT